MSIHSDWGDWLPQEIASAEPDGVDIWYLGCNGFVLRDREGTTVFIDPYLGIGDPPRTIRMLPVPFEPKDVNQADAVLVTHEHVDHVHGPSQATLLANSGGTLYGPDDAVAVVRDDEEWLETYDVTDDQLREITEGESFTVGEFTIHVEPAYDPDATHPVSYVLDHEAGTFFHGGDSKPAGAFATIGKRYNINLWCSGVRICWSDARPRNREPVRDEVVQRRESNSRGRERSSDRSTAPKPLGYVKADDSGPDRPPQPHSQLYVPAKNRISRNRWPHHALSTSLVEPP